MDSTEVIGLLNRILDKVEEISTKLIHSQPERPDNLLSQQQVMDRYGISARKLLDLRNNGRLAFKKGIGNRKGHKYFYLREDVEDLMRNAGRKFKR